MSHSLILLTERITVCIFWGWRIKSPDCELCTLVVGAQLGCFLLLLTKLNRCHLYWFWTSFSAHLEWKYFQCLPFHCGRTQALPLEAIIPASLIVHVLVESLVSLTNIRDIRLDSIGQSCGLSLRTFSVQELQKEFERQSEVARADQR